MTRASSTQAGGSRFELLDYLRFSAAIAVLAYHWLFRGIETGAMATLSYSAAAPIASYGHLGVELFFMISGFVIALSAHGRTASHFVVRRGVRLYPMFWVAVLLTACVTWAFGAPQFRVTLVQFVANLTMAPNIFDQPLVDGVYWTLLNELIFYGMIFLLLLFGLGRWLGAFFPGWALAMALIAIVAPQWSTVPLLGGLFSFFAAGAIISTIRRDGWDWWQALGLVASLFVALDDQVKAVARSNAAQGPYPQSTTLTCVIITGFFLLLLLQIHPRVTAWRLPKSETLGALTYPIYLLHAHLGFIFFNHLANDANKWWMYSAALTTLLVVSLMLHILIEKKMKRWWTRFFDVLVGAPVRSLERALDKVRSPGTASRSRVSQDVH